MNVEQIKELISIVEKSDITSFEIEESGYRIRIGKEGSINHNRQNNLYEPMKSDTEKFENEVVNFHETTPTELVTTPIIDNDFSIEVKSPMLGVFYSSPAPDATPFIKKGDRVKKGDVLCIIEAMKLMNEILAETEGEIVDICLENGQIVEFSQTMFKMK